MRLAVIRVLIIGALSAAGAFGQSAVAYVQITGHFYCGSGAPVAAAHVEAVNAGTGHHQTVTTSSSGLFQLPAAAFGRVLGDTGTASGFTPYRCTGVVITVGGVATLDVAMQLKGVSTEVLVDSGAPLIRLNGAQMSERSSHPTPSTTCPWCRGIPTTSFFSSQT